MPNEIVQIKIDDLIPNRFQPREIFEEKALNELADSIKQIGVIEPIIVRPIGSKYEIVAGERRYKASVLAGLNTIPCIVRELTDKESSIFAYVENAQRKQVSSIEEARVSERILKSNNYSQQQLSNELGINEASIANNLRLLSLPLEVQESLMRGEIAERHARLLLTVKDQEKQIELLERIKKERMSVKDLESEIKNMFNNDNNNVTITYNNGSFVPPRTDLNTPIPEINVNKVSETNETINSTPEPVINFTSEIKEPVVEEKETKQMDYNFLNIGDIKISDGNETSKEVNPITETPKIEEFKPFDIEDHSSISTIEPSFVPPVTEVKPEEPAIDFSKMFSESVQNSLNNMNINDEPEVKETLDIPNKEISYIENTNQMNLYNNLDDFLNGDKNNEVDDLNKVQDISNFVNETNVVDNINKVEDVSNFAKEETNDFLDFANNFNPALYENDINSTTVAPDEIVEETNRIQELKKQEEAKQNADFNNFINKYDSNYGVTVPKTEVYQEEKVTDFTSLGSEETSTPEQVMDFTNLGKNDYVESKEGYKEVTDKGELQSVDEVLEELRRVCEKIKNCKYKVDTEEIDFDDLYQITIKIDKRDY